MVYRMNCIELCAGCGGMALGFENQGFHHNVLVEMDTHCVGTLRTNKPEWNVLHEDVRKVSFTQYKGSVDIVVGGIPCQSFSIAGKRRGMDDERGNLFYEFKRCVEETCPTVFLIENVKGLLHIDKGNTFEHILKEMRSLGYTVYHTVLNSWDYKVPQKRERLFIFGTLLDKIFTFPNPFPDRPVLRDVLYDIQTEDKHIGVVYNERKKRILDMIPEGGCWINLPEDIQREYMGGSFESGGGKRGIAKRLHRDQPSLTLTTSPCQKQTERCHPTETRPLTVREYARIQTFPDTWKFQGSVNSMYKQIGNAVPCNLSNEIAFAIKKYLSDAI